MRALLNVKFNIKAKLALGERWHSSALSSDHVITDWRSLDARLRQDCEAFSQQRAYRILKTLAPKCIVVIGLETFSLLTHGDPVLSNGSRVLVRRGELCGVEAFGVIHLSGTRTSRSEVEMISGFFAKGLASEVALTTPIAPSAKPV